MLTGLCQQVHICRNRTHQGRITPKPIFTRGHKPQTTDKQYTNTQKDRHQIWPSLHRVPARNAGFGVKLC